MGKWLADAVPEWVTGPILIVGLPLLMLLLQRLVHRRAPHWRRGAHNDATGIMVSVAAVVYSVAIGLCVVTLWQRLEDARAATETEATNLSALAEGSRVCVPATRDRIRAGVIAYNQDVVDAWTARIHGEATPKVGADLDLLVDTVGQIRPDTEAQRAYVDNAMVRLTRATELRATSIRVARDQRLPALLWFAVLGGSVVVLALCLTCGVRDDAIRKILIGGVTATVGINLFLVIELNYPFYGAISVKPDSYANVVGTLERSR
jgi:hypothetical protein